MLIASLVTACTKSNTIVMTAEEWETSQMRKQLAEQARVESVGLPLLASAAPQCGSELGRTLGATFMNADSFLPMDRKTAQVVLGTDDRLQAVMVATKLAGTGGLQKGDFLLRVDGHGAPRGEAAGDFWSALNAAMLKSGRPLDIVVSRAGQEIPLRLQPTQTCGYRLVVWPSDDIFARTTGPEINVTSGMLAFAHDDEELAVVLSHEIAHHVLKHLHVVQAGDVAGAVSGGAFDMVAEMLGTNLKGALAKKGDSDPGAGAGLRPIEQELQADYVGLYIMAAAGLPIDGADAIWRRMRDTVPDAEGGASAAAERTHPTHAARFAAFQDWIAEIKAKQAKGLPLVPEQHDWSKLVALYTAKAGVTGPPSP
jgi:beta-barrel assembly-enhancing protease